MKEEVSESTAPLNPLPFVKQLASPGCSPVINVEADDWMQQFEVQRESAAPGLIFKSYFYQSCSSIMLLSTPPEKHRPGLTGLMLHVLFHSRRDASVLVFIFVASIFMRFDI